MSFKRLFWNSVGACVILTLLILSAGLASASITDNLVFWYRFDGGDNNSAAIDATGKYNLSTYAGTINYGLVGFVNKTINFTSSSAYANSTAGMSQVTGKGNTWGGWVYREQSMSSTVSHMSTDKNPATRGLDLLTAANFGGTLDTAVCLAHGTGSQFSVNSGASTIASNKWYFLVCRYNSTHLSIFLNGTLISSTAMTEDLRSSANRWHFAQNVDTSQGGSQRLDEMFWYNQSLSETEINSIYNYSLQNISYPFIAPPVASSLVFISPSPANDTAQFYTNSSSHFRTNATSVTNYNYTIIYFFNSTGGLLYSNTSSGNVSDLHVTGLSVGLYYVNASAYNTSGSQVANATQRVFTLYNITNGSITAPVNGSSVSSQFYNVTWTNITFNPSGAGVRGANFTLSFLNSSRGLIKQLTNTTNLFYYWNVYNENVTTGTYYLRVQALDNQSNGVNYTDSQINITTNTVINITAKSAVGGGSITGFSGWAYNVETGLNTSYTATGTQALVDFVRGNVTLYIDATNYTTNLSQARAGVNVSTPTYNYTFFLYETNSLNITFYDQSAPSTILSGPNITLDLISTLYTTSAYTTNGSIYLSLLTPETYTLRYTASGFTTRFYTLTIVNRSYNAISLYLINSSVASNVTITVVDGITNPVTNATVKALKYNLATNTYILQEICLTGASGTCQMTLTLNDEFYKFMVEYQGETKLVTVPEYIRDTTLTLQIDLNEEIGTEFFEYASIDFTFAFNNNSNNFRLDFNDIDGVASQFCVYVYRGVFNYTVYNSSCTTGASGTILVGVVNDSGVTYYGYAYFTQTGTQKYLGGDSYTYPDTTNPIDDHYALFLQFILTLGAASLALISAPFAAIMVPFSLYLGSWVGLNIFSSSALMALQVAGITLAVVLSVMKRG